MGSSKVVACTIQVACSYKLTPPPSMLAQSTGTSCSRFNLLVPQL